MAQKLVYYFVDTETGQTTEPQEIYVYNGMPTRVIHANETITHLDMGISRKYNEIYSVRWFTDLDLYMTTDGHPNYTYAHAIKRQLIINGERQVKFPNECNGLGYLKLPETDAQSDDPTGGILYGFCKHCNGKGCVEI
jgi:hypothetical protein